MSSVAILLANATYTKQQQLSCCLEDLRAMRSLVEATGRFDRVTACSDLDAESMRDAVRTALADGEQYDEILFYFSGHGHQSADGVFYFCGTTFDPKRPNATGLSQEDLHAMIRAAEPDLFVQIVDACASGTLLVKSEQRLLPLTKDGLRDLVFLASCRNDQSSFAGNPLSRFTSTLLGAVTHRTEGAIYYIDVINALRDEFDGDPVQTPFHVFQGTGREMLVDDAAKLETFRDEFRREWSGVGDDRDVQDECGDAGVGESDLTQVPERTLIERLRAAEERMPAAETMKTLVDNLFDGVSERFQVGEFAELFELRTEAHSTFAEPTTHNFIIQIMSRQQRLDRFVTAEIKKVRKKPTAYQRMLDTLGSSLMNAFPEYEDLFDLELNCRMERAQLKITLVPRFLALQQMVLVLTCAPSLKCCYVFEIVTRHTRTDLASFDHAGAELYKHWYTVDWDDDAGWLVDRVCTQLSEAVRNYVSALDQRLSED
jgi:hypothetical protein